MDKQTLLDMGFVKNNEEWYEYQTKDQALVVFAKIKNDHVSKYELSVDCAAWIFPLCINTKFDLEQLLKILGE